MTPEQLGGIGLRVFPLQHRSKVPATAHGFKDARIWVGSWNERYNVGVATGQGIVVVDVDPRNGGDETMLRLPPMPETPRVLTGRGDGGIHYYFRSAVPVACHTVAGVDVKGDGGYVVAPPSIHPDTGRPYLWDSGAHPQEVSMAELPAWFHQAAKRPIAVTGDAMASFLAVAFAVAGLVGRPAGRVVCVVCPWAHLHTDGRGDGQDTSTVLLPPTKNQLGRFHCSHSHCDGATSADVMAELPQEAWTAAVKAYPGAVKALMWSVR